jgi:N-acetylneuraminate synthase
LYIGNIEITPDRAFIVAEAGQNHNGSLDLALRLVDAAVEAGVDAIKWQKRAIELCVPPEQRDIMRSTPWGQMRYIDYRYMLEFGQSEFDIIDVYCQDKGIMWFVSPWDIPSFVFMKENYDLPCWKIPSACLTDHELLRAMKRRQVPIVLSTGMSTSHEIAEAATILLGQGNETVICHCNSTYPCPPEDLNLRCIHGLQEGFPDAVVGYSGHEVALAPTIAARTMGALYIERHITLDRSSWGSDQASSVEPSGFKRLVKDIRLIEKCLGDGQKRITGGEVEPMRRLRRQLVG